MASNDWGYNSVVRIVLDFAKCGVQNDAILK